MTADLTSENNARASYGAVVMSYAQAMRNMSQGHELDAQMVHTFLRQVGQGSILGAGAGVGRLSGYLAGQGTNVRGMDLSPAMVREARAEFPALDFQEGLLLGLPYEDGSFAGVLLWHSVIYLTDAELEQAMAETARVARLGGLVLTSSQSGDRTVDLRQVYARMGHDLSLLRRQRTADGLSGGGWSAGGRGGRSCGRVGAVRLTVGRRPSS